MEDAVNIPLHANDKIQLKCSRLLRFTTRKTDIDQLSYAKELSSNPELTTPSIKYRKCKGRWHISEHCRFLKSILSYGTNWAKIRSYIKTRSSVQIRSHSQKYLIRLERCKNNPYQKELFRRKSIY